MEGPFRSLVEVNTDGSVIGGHATCGGLFRDTLGTFRGAFYCNIGIQSVFYAEVLEIILAIEFAAQKRWSNIWLESDSTSALMIFSNSLLVPLCYVTVGIMLDNFGFRLFLLIFFVKETAAQTSWLLWVTPVLCSLARQSSY